MTDYDVFNGDADGIISLVQLRLSEPRHAELVTGRKRDIKLLDRVQATSGDRVTVLDISMRSNADDLRRILDTGAKVQYFDHHNAGDIPDHANLDATINTASEVCTAVLVDQYLGGAHRAWAVAAAYGDNFPAMAERLATGHHLPLAQLKELGELINYNGYGGSVDDLLYHPADLFRLLVKHATPMAFLTEAGEPFFALQEQYASDWAMAQASQVMDNRPKGRVLALSDTAASRRISGDYGNKLAQENPDRAHAILTAQADGYLVSIRAPINKREGADTLALQFETGGGRAAAAGINHLPDADVTRFIEAFRAAF
ncbi:DHH family phosphoesterase [Litorimonas sp. RW-G-Af-16]|uniref:DHH family phosphoesterase n=1 Tax=Litorimonas sp. RW-G-Af-16 TaxID=3241168 RepID=UPI00390C4F7A